MARVAAAEPPSIRALDSLILFPQGQSFLLLVYLLFVLLLVYVFTFTQTARLNVSTFTQTARLNVSTFTLENCPGSPAPVDKLRGE